MSDSDTKTIRTEDALRRWFDDEIPGLLDNHVEAFVEALGNKPDALRGLLEAAGFQAKETALITPEMLMEVHQTAAAGGRIDNGLGMSYRRSCDYRRYEDLDGNVRRTYLWGETEDLANAWLRAFFAQDNVDPVSLKPVRQLVAELDERVRAPADPFLGEPGQAGGSLVPTVVAAEIFEEANERFALKGRLMHFVSAGPLKLPRRTVEVTVNRGGLATDIDEDKPETGSVNLSPARVGVITYHDPLVVQAAAVGPIRWVIGQIAEAIAKDDQRVILVGSESNGEPRGISGLPTSGGSAFDRAKTAAYDDTTALTKRESMRTAYYSVSQPHRQSRSFTWVGNSDALREMASHNDRDQSPWDEEHERYLRRDFVESSALVTTSDATTIIGGDFSKYAWLESPGGLRLEQTSEGGRAWESDTIGVKAVQYIDGAPVIPPAFTVVTAVDV